MDINFFDMAALINQKASYDVASYFSLEGVKLPAIYNDKPHEYWDSIIIDDKFLELNPQIKFTSGKIIELMRKIISSPKGIVLTDEKKEQRKEKFKDLLLRDKEGKLEKLYKQISEYFIDEYDEQLFISGIIEDKKFDSIDLSYVTPKMWASLSFLNCTFDFLRIGYDYNEINEKSISEHPTFIYDCNINKLQMPVTIKNWDNNSTNRLYSSNITYQTNIYLEFKRICNMKCCFCRNSGLDNSVKYDYEKIVSNLKVIYPHINNLVIGGGEPTLLKDDLFRLKDDLGYDIFNSINPTIVTNCSLNIDELFRLGIQYNLILSRHAVDDDENAKIFGKERKNLLNSDELKKLKSLLHSRRTQTLCCTCFEGGVDSKEKMLEYLSFAQDLGFRNVLFQTLHQEDNFNSKDRIPKTIDKNVIPNTLSYLERIGFMVSNPIYSTSSYELHIASSLSYHQILNISFKEYKDSLEIVSRWNTACKRCFDMSMAPNGDVYETWDQQKDPIKIKNGKIYK